MVITVRFKKAADQKGECMFYCVSLFLPNLAITTLVRYGLYESKIRYFENTINVSTATNELQTCLLYNKFELDSLMEHIFILDCSRSSTETYSPFSGILVR